MSYLALMFFKPRFFKGSFIVVFPMRFCAEQSLSADFASKVDSCNDNLVMWTLLH